MQNLNRNQGNYSVEFTESRRTSETGRQITTRIRPQNQFRRFADLEIEQTVDRCFEQRVEQDPDCLAVEDRSRSLERSGKDTTQDYSWGESEKIINFY